MSGGTSLAILLLLGAILTPREFGAIAVAMLIFEGVAFGLSPGIGRAYQAHPPSAELSRSALGVALILGCAFGAAAILVTPIVATLFGVPEASPLASVALVALPARRWNEVRIAQFERDLRFSRPSVLISAASIVGVAAAGVAAALGAGPWTLVVYLLASEYLSTALLTIFGPSPRLPGLIKHHTREILAFSRGLLGDAIAVYGYTNVDDAVIARVAGPAALGAYSFAYRLANLASLAVARPAQRVLLPLLSQAKEDERKKGALFARSLALVSCLSGTVGSMLVVLGPPLLDLAYGQRWTDSYTPMRILAVYGAFRAVGSITGTVFVSAGRPGLIMRFAFWQLVALGLIILPAVSRFGIVGAALAVTLPLMVGVGLAVTIAARLLDVGRARAVRIVLVRWTVAAVVGLVAYWITSFVGGATGLIAGFATHCLSLSALLFSED